MESALVTMIHELASRDWVVLLRHISHTTSTVADCLAFALCDHELGEIHHVQEPIANDRLSENLAPPSDLVIPLEGNFGLVILDENMVDGFSVTHLLVLERQGSPVPAADMQTTKRGKAGVEASSVTALWELKAAATVDASVMSLAPVLCWGVVGYGQGGRFGAGLQRICFTYNLYGHAMDSCVTSRDSEKDQVPANNSVITMLPLRQESATNNDIYGPWMVTANKRGYPPREAITNKKGSSESDKEVDVNIPRGNNIVSFNVISSGVEMAPQQRQRLVSTSGKQSGSRKRIGDHGHSGLKLRLGKENCFPSHSILVDWIPPGFGEHGASTSTVPVSSAPQGNTQVISTVLVYSQIRADMDNVDNGGALMETHGVCLSLCYILL
ncbi:hypothetical protein V6N12_057185 [Hibiscus sabdariffa]|uniref:Uncharacterized protein n=1 Tax=Hibiscus sabdariffa TaxID=183260 RepID=A0ABR1ZWR8_9ROSI